MDDLPWRTDGNILFVLGGFGENPMERWFVRVMVFMFLLSLSKIEVWAFWSGLMLLA